jgi:hypothetical protein
LDYEIGMDQTRVAKKILQKKPERPGFGFLEDVENVLQERKERR